MNWKKHTEKTTTTESVISDSIVKIHWGINQTYPTGENQLTNHIMITVKSAICLLPSLTKICGIFFSSQILNCTAGCWLVLQFQTLQPPTWTATVLHVVTGTTVEATSFQVQQMIKSTKQSNLLLLNLGCLCYKPIYLYENVPTYTEHILIIRVHWHEKNPFLIRVTTNVPGFQS